MNPYHMSGALHYSELSVDYNRSVVKKILSVFCVKNSIERLGILRFISIAKDIFASTEPVDFIMNQVPTIGYIAGCQKGFVNIFVITHFILNLKNLIDCEFIAQ
jgi:hypothetical protein